MTKQKFISAAVKLAALSNQPRPAVKQSTTTHSECKILSWHNEPLQETFAIPLLFEVAA